MSEKSSNGKLGNAEIRRENEKKRKREEKMLTKTAPLLQYV